MKTAVVLAAAASAALVSAQPHGHQHFHHAKRVPTAVAEVDASATAYVYELNGENVSQDEVCSGIEDGTLTIEGGVPSGLCAQQSSISVSSTSATSASTTAAAATTSSSAAAAEFYEQSSSTAATTSSSSVASSSSASSAAASSSSSSASVSVSVSYDTSGYSNFTSSAASSSYPDFVDGIHSCSDGPPLDYGAVWVDWLSSQGWTGTQTLESDGSLGSTGTTCEEGQYCSYACPPGWQKYQWPSDQPSDGASLGGLLCKGGLLYKTSTSSQLCSQGSGDVEVENKGSESVSICRTDYPGTESETVPLYVAAGSTEPVTSPIESEYYVHEGSSTSAQYYLNPFGIDPSVGCTWDGNGDGATGNWAPIVLGVGYKDGTNWLSIQQNTPTSYAAFSGTVEISGDSCSGTCKYSDGEYCDDSGCQSHDTDGAGCTVSCSGSATYVVSS